MHTNWSTIWIYLCVLTLVSCGDSESQNITPEGAITLPTEISNAFSDRQDRGMIANPDINEASGLAVSRNNANALWTHNDSGDDARVFLIGDHGQNLAVFYLEGINNRDWEDMAIAQDPNDGKTYIYVAEIGDNLAVHADISIYRFEEPVVNSASFVQDTVPASEIEQYTFTYEDGARDAETLMIDQDGSIFIVTKREAKVRVYKTSTPLSTSSTNTLTKTDSLETLFITAGDYSSNGILLKTYDSVYYWSSPSASSTIQEIFDEATPLKIPYTLEPQGESIAWKPDGSGYYTLSEAAGQEVRFICIIMRVSEIIKMIKNRGSFVEIFSHGENGYFHFCTISIKVKIPKIFFI